ncbi:MAG: hypothetical protein PWP23_3354 [Candidatus Sumerlaeota bacterium]|nr:hypothetical protein [Candidatus Sumerlaeota bacterium]
MHVIGQSREGRALFGLVVGNGPLRAAIVAGAHADEPVGPRTAVHFAAALARGEHEWARRLAARFTFHIVPHANPDGDALNAEWQRNPGDFAHYLQHAVRDLPGDDVEFNYPRTSDDRDTRPENLAVADFWRASGGTFHFHASLHSMGVAEGAWFLVCREWAERAVASGLTDRLAAAASDAGLGLHDVERHGEKGFKRFAPGFSTTPRSDAMRAFFLRGGDPATAALFRPSSMEFVQSLGGDPLCIVSEFPYFRMSTAAASSAPLDMRPFFALLSRLRAARGAAAQGNLEPARALAAEYAIEPVAWEVHHDMQMRFLREALALVSKQ